MTDVVVLMALPAPFRANAGEDGRFLPFRTAVTC